MKSLLAPLAVAVAGFMLLKKPKAGTAPAPDLDTTSHVEGNQLVDNTTGEALTYGPMAEDDYYRSQLRGTFVGAPDFVGGDDTGTISPSTGNG